MFRKIICTQLGSDFRAVTRIVSAEIPTNLEADQILVRNHFVGINASDVNFVAGRYQKVAPPFDVGFESVGVVEKVGSGVNLKVGQAVGLLGYGAFSEYQVTKAKSAMKLPICSPEMIPLFVSGLTASVALDEVGQIKSGGGETVLVTAAAGATGVFAVQLAKQAGNTVIGTCSSDEKVAELKALGCDRVINYKTEDFKSVMRKEFPNGVDVVYESVGGEMFENCVNALGVGGRLIIIGFISGYKDQKGWTGEAQAGASVQSPLPVRLLAKSASVRGFFLNNFAHVWPQHISRLTEMTASGKLKVVIDRKPFVGLESIPDALDHMYSGGNIGKVVVDIRSQKSSL